MQNKKVMTITPMQSDLYEVPGYIGENLDLPANRDEIQEAQLFLYFVPNSSLIESSSFLS